MLPPRVLYGFPHRAKTQRGFEIETDSRLLSTSSLPPAERAYRDRGGAAQAAWRKAEWKKALNATEVLLFGA